MATDRTDGEATEGALNSANDPVFDARFVPVRQLVLDQGASLVPRGLAEQKTDELWLGDAFDPLEPGAGSIGVYVRLGSSQALVAELVCGCVARALNLPAPEVFLISIPPGHLPDSSMVHSDRPTYCVGTRDIGGSTFAQLLNAGTPGALKLLREWSHLTQVAAFDEWLANPDRNMGNLVYVAQTLHIIDHAEAFGGSCRELFPLLELTATSFENLLAEIFNRFDINARVTFLQQAHAWISETAAALDVPSILASTPTALWLTPEQDRELVDFITERLTITHSLLCHRLGHPQLSLQG